MGLLDDRVALVTGAGRGIGREIALCLASQGAKVVVNDIGVGLDGRGGGEDAASQETASRGGEPVPNHDSLSDFEAAGLMIGTAIDAFVKMDILVNNAGIV